MSLGYFFSLMLAIAVSIFMILSFLGSSDDAAQYNTTQKEEAAQARINWIVRDFQKMEYLIDTRTNLCYAYLWGGPGNGGPAIANVPCGSLNEPIEFSSGE